MPIIPEYKRQVTTSQPLKIPSNNIKMPAEAFGANAMASVGAAAYKTATEVITREEEALADAAIASAATQYRASLESMKSVRGTQALNPEFENTQMEAMLGGMRAIRDKLPTAGAQNRFNEWVTRSALPDQFRFGIQSHVRAQTQQIEKQAFDAQINLYESELIATDDPMQALTKLEEISRATIQYGRKNGQADIDIKNALAAKALTIANQKLMSAYNRSSADQLQGMAYAFKPFVPEEDFPVLQSTVDKKRREEGISSAASQVLGMALGQGNNHQLPSTVVGTGIGKTTINTGIREEAASDGSPIIRLGNGNSISFKDITVTPETFPSTVMAMNRATRDNGFVLPTGAGNMKHVLPHMEYISQLERERGIPHGVLLANSLAESGWNPNAVSPAGAKGIAQFMEGTAKRFGLNDRTNVRESFRAMADYISYLMKNYTNGDVIMAVALYNWGEGNGHAEKVRAGVMPDETRNHMRKVQLITAATSRLMDNVLGAQVSNAPEGASQPTQSAQAPQSVSYTKSGGRTELSPALTDGGQQNAASPPLPDHSPQQSSPAGQSISNPHFVTDRQLQQNAAAIADVQIDEYGAVSGPPEKVSYYEAVLKEARGMLAVQRNDFYVKQRVTVHKVVSDFEENKVLNEMLYNTLTPENKKIVNEAISGEMDRRWVESGLVAAETDGALAQRVLRENPQVVPPKKLEKVLESAHKKEQEDSFWAAGVLDKRHEAVFNAVKDEGLLKDLNEKETARFKRAFGRKAAMAERAEGRALKGDELRNIAIDLYQIVPTRAGLIFTRDFRRYELMVSPNERDFDKETGLFVPHGSDLAKAQAAIAEAGLPLSKNLLNFVHTYSLQMAGAEMRPEAEMALEQYILGGLKLPGVTDVDLLSGKRKEKMDAILREQMLSPFVPTPRSRPKENYLLSPDETKGPLSGFVN